MMMMSSRAYMALCRLQAAAMAKLESVRQQSATGMQYALQQKKFTEISVSLQPNCIIIPDQGVYRKWANGTFV